MADTTTGALLRAADGRCVQCAPGEVGELLGLVNQRDASRNFAGYTDGAATRRKLVRDVAKRGDCWFRTGDLLKADCEGFVYFVDRMGDTFRYKGENVSTAEVGSVVGAACGDAVQHALVYGVPLPGVDGRVGMAALVLAEGVAAAEIGMQSLYEKMEGQLPEYAVPRFFRLLASGDGIESTITWKPKKEKLMQEGVEIGSAVSYLIYHHITPPHNTT